MATRVGAFLILLLLASCKSKPAAQAELTPEAKSYASRNLKLSDISMKATESLGGQVLTEIEGKVTNAGDRTVDYASVACVFYDTINQMVLREKVAIVKKPLKPGETRAFRLPFDNIPQSWNNQLPQVVISQIRLS